MGMGQSGQARNRGRLLPSSAQRPELRTREWRATEGAAESSHPEAALGAGIRSEPALLGCCGLGPDPGAEGCALGYRQELTA